MLYLVATPIGNLEDITARAARILSSVDIVLAEDTRTSRILLSHLGSERRMHPFHDFNKEHRTPWVIEQLEAGRSVALISDAGTPGIADPAFYLVRAARNAAIPVSALPGPCAAIAALVCSGLPVDRFIFDGFLPARPGKRKKALAGYHHETRTVIVYESPHRILRTLADMEEVLGCFQVVIAREMTKLHEEFLCGSAAWLRAHFETIPPRGEMVVVFNTTVPASTAERQTATSCT